MNLETDRAAPARPGQRRVVFVEEHSLPDNNQLGNGPAHVNRRTNDGRAALRLQRAVIPRDGTTVEVLRGRKAEE
jgi:hypothetical protein